MQNENTNLATWNKVATTDPTYTKEYTGPGGYSGTSISGAYMVMKATEVWGPIGVHWGYEILEERIDNGHPVYDDDGEILGHETAHTLKLKLFVQKDILDPNYSNTNDPGEDWAEVVHFGHTPYVTWSRTYKNWRSDPEAPKKSMTDALKKCLSMFGFSADIFLGMFDDIGYVQEAKAKANLEKIENKEERILEEKKQYKDWFDKHLHIIQTAVTVNELELVFKSSYRKAQRKGDREGLLKLTRAKDVRLKQLQEKNNDSITQDNDGNAGNSPAGGRSGNGDSGSGHAGSNGNDVQRQGGTVGEGTAEHGRKHSGGGRGDKAPPSKKKAVRKSKN